METDQLVAALGKLSNQLADLSTRVDAVEESACPDRHFDVEIMETDHTLEDLIKTLQLLKADGKVKPHDWRKIKSPLEIYKGSDIPSVVRSQLTQLYLAITHSWKDTAVFQQQPLEQQLGISPLPQPIKVVTCSSKEWTEIRSFGMFW